MPYLSVYKISNLKSRLSRLFHFTGFMGGSSFSYFELDLAVLCPLTLQNAETLLNTRSQIIAPYLYAIDNVSRRSLRRSRRDNERRGLDWYAV